MKQTLMEMGCSLQINMNILERENLVSNHANEDPEEHEEPPIECVDTKLIIWEQDSFEEFEVDYLNQVYPEKINQNTVSKGCQFVFHFLASSLNYWVELKDGPEIEEGKLSSKDAKYLSSAFAEQECDNYHNFNRWGKHFNKKEQFLQWEKKEKDFQAPKGEKVHEYERQGQKFEVHKYKGDNKDFIPYKHKFQLLFLFYIDGVSFVDEEISEWQYYIIFKWHEGHHVFVGVLSKFLFKITAVRERQRISQVFIIPSYQKYGHGKQLLDFIYKESLTSAQCFQLTTEVPSFQYQCLRDYKELQLILEAKLVDFSEIKAVAGKEDVEQNQSLLLSKERLRKIKEQIKIPGNQVERLMNLLIYAKIQCQEDNDMAKAYFEEHTRQRIIFNRSAFKSRKKIPHITFSGKLSNMKEFFLEKAQEDMKRNRDEIQEILSETLEGFLRVISKLNRNKLLQNK